MVLPRPGVGPESVLRLQSLAGNRAVTTALDGLTVQRSVSFYETPPQANLNPAVNVFTNPLSNVGITYPIINGMRTWTSDHADTDEMRMALNPPEIETQGGQGGRQYRITGPGRNAGSALVRYPRPAPWQASFDVHVVIGALAGAPTSRAVVEPVLPQLPQAGVVNVVITEDPAQPITAETLIHEQQHASDIRTAFLSRVTPWDEGLTTLVGSGTWYPDRQAFNIAVNEAAQLGRDDPGDPVTRLAEELNFAIGMDANFFHQVTQHSDPVFSAARWDQHTNTLQLVMRDLPRGPQ
jgi:hypothetical protein